MVRPRGRAAGRAPERPPPPDYMAAMMQQFELNRQFMTNIMAQFPHQNNNNHNQNQLPITLSEFVRLNPVTFRNSEQPLDADDWLRDIAYEMESANVAPASYVTFATYFLKGPAAQWWSAHKHTLPPGTHVTWDEFQAAFRARYIPQGIMDRKKTEFRNLVQGNKTVEAYQREFLDLSRYAEEDIPNDARRQEKFRSGLHPDLELALAIQDFPDFATLVNKAILLETAQAKHKESQKRYRDAGSSSSAAQKRRIWIPNSMYCQHAPAPAPRPSYAASRLPPPPPRQPKAQAPRPNAPLRPEDGLCFKCRKPGHLAKDCRSTQNQLGFPRNGRGNGRGNSQARNYNTGSANYGRGHAYNIDIEEVQDQPATVMGTLLVNSVPASVLFDSGASHSFMSEAFALSHDITLDRMNLQMAVRTPGGQCHTDVMAPNVIVEIGGLEFFASPIILKSSTIDLILGMD